MGIPFYGYDFTKHDQGSSSSSSKGKASSQSASANPIMGPAFLAALRKAKPALKWEVQHAEHKIKYKVSCCCCTCVFAVGVCCVGVASALVCADTAQPRCATLCCAVQDGGLRHTVYYPTPAALEARVRLAEQLGVGLSIWELGQGMDSFLDLL